MAETKRQTVYTLINEQEDVKTFHYVDGDDVKTFTLGSKRDTGNPDAPKPAQTIDAATWEKLRENTALIGMFDRGHVRILESLA